MRQKHTKTIKFLYFAMGQTLDKAINIYKMETKGAGIRSFGKGGCNRRRQTLFFAEKTIRR